MKLIVKACGISILLGAIVFWGLQLRPASSLPCHNPEFKWYDRSWMSEPLRNNDWAFQQTKWQVERLFEKTDLPRKRRLINDFKSEAYRNPQDAKKQFAYGYVTFLTMREHGSSLTQEQRRELMCGVYAWMSQPPAQQSFEYTRLRFMIAYLTNSKTLTHFPNGIDKATAEDKTYVFTGQIVETDEFENLGKRMVERRPDDNVLKSYVVDVIGFDWKLRLAYAKEVQKAFPKKASSYRSLAGAYQATFYQTKSVADARRAKEIWNKYISMLPPQSLEKKHAESMLESLKYYLDIARKKGRLKT